MVRVIGLDGNVVEVSGGGTVEDALKEANVDPANLGQATLTVNGEVVGLTTPLEDGAELVMTPPVKNG